MMQKRRLNTEDKERSRERSKHIFVAGLFYLDHSHFFQSVFLVWFQKLIYCRVWHFFLFTLPAANASKNASPLKMHCTKGQAFPLKRARRSGLSKAVEKNVHPCGLLEAYYLVKFACNTETARISCSSEIEIGLSKKKKNKASE